MVMTATQIRKTILKIVVTERKLNTMIGAKNFKTIGGLTPKKLISQLGYQGGSEYGLINNVLY